MDSWVRKMTDFTDLKKGIIDLMGKEYYYIEMSEGERYLHVEEYIWDASEAGRVVYIDGEEVDADVVVTEYTFCEIPLKELLNAENRYDKISEYESWSHQYEMEYTFEQFIKEFPPSVPGFVTTAGTCYSAEHLELEDITEDTPCGWYYYTI